MNRLVNERYRIINESKYKKWLADSPIKIEKTRLLFDRVNKNVILQLKMFNLTDKIIKSIFLKIESFDDNMDFLSSCSEAIFPGADIGSRSSFGDREPIVLESCQTSDVTIIISKVVFEDGFVWKNEGDNPGIDLPPQNVISHEDPLYKQVVIECTNKQIKPKYWFEDNEIYWCCTCGQPNKKDIIQCLYCGIEKEWLGKHFDVHYLIEKTELREKKEFEARIKNERKEKERQKKEYKIALQKRKRRNRLTKIAILGMVLVMITVLCMIKIVMPAKNYNKALTLMTQRDYEAAVYEFEKLGDYKDVKELINEILYQNALALVSAKDYKAAVSEFENLGEYKDAKAQIEGIYLNAVELLNNKHYDEAKLIFVELGDYNDSKERLKTIEIAMAKYEDAMEMLNNKQYDEAAVLFAKLGEYKDSKEQLRNAELQLKKNNNIKQAMKTKPISTVVETSFSEAKPGDIIKFGTYEQDNNSSNGKEDILWRVLAIENGKALVISEYCLDVSLYNITVDTWYVAVTWEICSLRNWLNNDFYNTAFTSNERSRIATTTIINADTKGEYSALKSGVFITPGGNNTQDKVFILSIDEANKYFKSDSERVAKNTDFAVAKGIYKSNKSGFWWLRSPGYYGNYASVVDSAGFVHKGGERVDARGSVRPVLWINL